MKRLQAFILGWLEANSDFTTSYDDDYDLLIWYDRGRNLRRLGQ